MLCIDAAAVVTEVGCNPRCVLLVAFWRSLGSLDLDFVQFSGICGRLRSGHERASHSHCNDILGEPFRAVQTDLLEYRPESLAEDQTIRFGKAVDMLATAAKPLTPSCAFLCVLAVFQPSLQLALCFDFQRHLFSEFCIEVKFVNTSSEESLLGFMMSLGGCKSSMIGLEAVDCRRQLMA